MKTKRTKIITIDGINYYAERPQDCKYCYFWKNRKVGCILGSENCYYLAKVVKNQQETKCDNCPYSQARPCVSASCYKDLVNWLQERRAEKEACDVEGTEAAYAG